LAIKNPFVLPNLSESLPLDQFLERNLDLYHDNLRLMAATYSGRLVTDKALSKWLLAVLNKIYRIHKTIAPRLIPPGFPLEEFLPLQVEFTVQAPGFGTMYPKKWYFIRRARRIRGPDKSIVHKLDVDAPSDVSEGPRSTTG